MAHPQRTRDKAIEGLLLGQTIGEVVESARVSRRTLIRWINEDEAFRTQLDNARQRLFERHIAAMAELTGEGIRRLRQILKDDNAGAMKWIRACDLIFREARASEVAAMRQRLDEVESKLERFLEGLEQ